MGGFVSKAVEQNVTKNQEFMIEMNRITVNVLVYTPKM